MRIIAGSLKGSPIPSPKEEIVSPTLDRIKENIFNILQFEIKDSVCLDLFCGSGALGLECLSRGAKEVVFSDSNKNNILALKKFLTKHLIKNAKIECGDFYDVIKKYSQQKKTFDIIFLDPPYESDLGFIALSKIFKFCLLSPKGVIVWEHLVGSSFEKYKTKIKDSRVYGKTQIDFLKN